MHALAEAFGGFAQLGAARIKEFAKERFEEGILGVFRKGRTKEEYFQRPCEAFALTAGLLVLTGRTVEVAALRHREAHGREEYLRIVLPLPEKLFGNLPRFA